MNIAKSRQASNMYNAHYALFSDSEIVFKRPVSNWTKIGEIPMEQEGDGPIALNRHMLSAQQMKRAINDGYTITKSYISPTRKIIYVAFTCKNSHLYAAATCENLFLEGRITCGICRRANQSQEDFANVDLNEPIKSAKKVEAVTQADEHLHAADMGAHLRTVCTKYGLKPPAKYKNPSDIIPWKCENDHVFVASFNSICGRVSRNENCMVCIFCEIDLHEKDHRMRAVRPLSKDLNRNMTIDWRCMKCDKYFLGRGLRTLPTCTCTAASRAAQRDLIKRRSERTPNVNLRSPTI